MTQTNPHAENPLSSTDSPETYYTGDVNQGASQISTPPALNPVELDELDPRVIEMMVKIREYWVTSSGEPELRDFAKYVLGVVDAAVAANLEKCLSIIDVSDMLHYMYAELEQLKNKDNHETTR